MGTYIRREDFYLRSVTFIHVADLHLDSPFLGLPPLPKELKRRIQESTFRSFSKIIDIAIDKRIDFLLISGDIYDGEDRSIKAQARLRKELVRLHEKNIPVYMIHGNHDHLGGNWTTLELPPNVHVFGDQVERKRLVKTDGTTVHLYGFSYPKRHVYESLLSFYKKEGEATFHIGLLHGQVEGNNDHTPYAPFTVQQLLTKGFDYWALGHIHKQQILHMDPPMVYPGNIQGRHRKEQGEKGGYLVTLTEHSEPSMTFLATSDVNWETIMIHIEKGSTFHDIFLQCQTKLQSIRKEQVGQLVDLHIELEERNEELLQKVQTGEFIEILQEGEEQEEAFVWPYNVRVVSPEVEVPLSAMFLNELEETIQALSMETIYEGPLKELFHHYQAGKYISPLTEQEMNELIDEAKTTLFTTFQTIGKQR
jgi:DNA repair protein SbcD/Mre11